jgi:ubiquinone/menaquinone biosynthesis C-methylase UbiE
VNNIKAVQAFWDANPCGSRLSDEPERREYFAEIEAKRYSHESHISQIARFGDFKGKRVLEIGTGIGTDGLQFQTNGARYVGIDLTLAGQRLAKEQFGLAGCESNVMVGNAEILPLAGDYFDHIYSFGVIHHSPSTETIVNEMFRVLKPGGTFCVMIYNRSSINYYLEIMFLRKLFRWLLYPAFMPKFLSRLLRLDRNKLETHRRILLSKRNVTKQEWISMNTDGPECPLAKVYNKREALKLFDKFSDVRTEIWFFDRSHWPFIGRIMPNSMTKWLGSHWGWHRIVYGRKPVA